MQLKTDFLINVINLSIKNNRENVKKEILKAERGGDKTRMPFIFKKGKENNNELKLILNYLEENKDSGKESHDLDLFTEFLEENLNDELFNEIVCYLNSCEETIDLFNEKDPVKLVVVDFDYTIIKDHGHSKAYKAGLKPIFNGRGLILNGKTEITTNPDYDSIKVREFSEEFFDSSDKFFNKEKQLKIFREMLNKNIKVAIASNSQYPDMIDVALEKMGLTKDEINKIDIICGQATRGKNNHIKELKKAAEIGPKENTILIDDDKKNIEFYKDVGSALLADDDGMHWDLLEQAIIIEDDTMPAGSQSDEMVDVPYIEKKAEKAEIIKEKSTDIELAIFDFDQTMINAHATKEALKKGLEMLFERGGISLNGEEFKSHNERGVEYVKNNNYNKNNELINFAHDFFDSENKFFDKEKQLKIFRKLLKDDVKIVISSFTQYPAIIDVMLEKMGLTVDEIKKIDVICGEPLHYENGESLYGKSSLDIREELTQKIKNFKGISDPEKVIYIDDNPLYIRDAKELGLKTLEATKSGEHWDLFGQQIGVYSEDLSVNDPIIEYYDYGHDQDVEISGHYDNHNYDSDYYS